MCFSSTIVFSTARFLLSVSELLMGEVDSSTLLSLLPTEKSRVSGHVFFFYRETDLPHKKKKKNSENDTVCPTHAFMVVAVKERPVPFPIFTQSVASLASSTVTS